MLLELKWSRIPDPLPPGDRRVHHMEPSHPILINACVSGFLGAYGVASCPYGDSH